MDKSPMRRRQRGLTLIEAMISITIGLVVIGAVSYVYLSSKGAYRGNESIARIQEAGRFALDAITRDLRRGGALGCGTAASVTTVSLVNIGVLVGNTTTTIDPTRLRVDATTGQPIPVLGFAPAAYAPLTAPPAGWTAPPPAQYFDGDVLQLQIAAGAPVRVTTTPDPGLGQLTVYDNRLNGGPNPNFAANNYAVLGNCAGAAIIQVNNSPTATSPATVAFTPPGAALSGQTDFSPPTYPTLQHFDQVTYYVAQVPNSVSPTYPNGLSALYRYSMNTGTAEELVENIEDLDIVYGVDTNGTHTAGLYQHAGSMQPGDWANVVSVRISVIAVGDQPGVVLAPQTLQFRGADPNPVPAPLNAPDTRLRQVFTATAALRSRLPVL